MASTKLVHLRVNQEPSIEAINSSPEDFLNEAISLYKGRYYDFVRYAASIVHSEVAEDIVQEAFEAAIKALDRFETRGVPLFGWICTIIRNKAVDHLRRNALLIVTDDLEVLDRPNVYDDPEVIFINKEIILKGLQAPGSPKQRQILFHQASGFISSEIADNYDIAESTARVTAHKARKAARAALREYLAA